jgi:hypothetical protein
MNAIKSGPPDPIVKIHFEVEVDKPVGQRGRHSEDDSRVLSSVAGRNNSPPSRKFVFANAAVEGELIK